MKLARYEGRLAVLGPDGGAFLTDVTDGKFTDHDVAAIERWDEIEELVGTAPRADFAIDPTKLGSPIQMPRQIFGIGMNYRDHAREMGLTDEQLPKAPSVFTKFPTSITGPRAEIALPSRSVDYEAELVVVIQKYSERVSEADAWSHVAGVMVGNDLSERAVQLSGPVPQFSMGKSFPGFSPTGPALVSLAELDDPDSLDLGCRIGEETLQSGNTKDLIFSVPELIAWLSAICPLLPGDTIWTGTPAGVGNARNPKRMLEAGETLTTWITGVGEMGNELVAGPTYPTRS